MKEKLFIYLQYLLPKKYLSIFLGALASLRAGWFTHKAIQLFVNKYKVNLQEAKQEQVDQYQTFNDFFTRELKEDSREIADSALISPVDGTISQLGRIHDQSLIQAKGKLYSIQSLLANEDRAADFINGQFATLYLSPRDYHRIHMPIGGSFKIMLYFSGSLFSVNLVTVIYR